MKYSIQTSLLAATFFFVAVNSHAQVTAHNANEPTSKPTVQATLTEGSTMAGGSSGDTLSKALESSTKSTADKLKSGRFLKENRRSGEFVGTDAGERREFVGAQEASGTSRVRSATSGLRVKKSREANVQYRAATERRNAMYDPRLVVAFNVNRQSPRAIQAGLQKRLADSRDSRWGDNISVTVRGDTAVLSGKVASSHDREMAELVLMFEPGVAKVENRLAVIPLQQQNPAK